MDYTNFETGGTFPLPIKAKGDGGLFQVDVNGAMFILQLSRTDVIAREAFRTGEIELALAEAEGVLLLLYRIDGIFREGWGDAPWRATWWPESSCPRKNPWQTKRSTSTSWIPG